MTCSGVFLTQIGNRGARFQLGSLSWTSTERSKHMARPPPRESSSGFLKKVGFLSSWWWGEEEKKPLKPTDAIREQSLRNRFVHFLDHTDPPATFRAAHVAQELTHNELKAMGYEDWKDALPAVVELAFELREAGYLEILKGGKVLGDDVSALDIEGSVRIRRVDG